MLAGDLVLVGAHEPAVADDFRAGDVESVDPVRRREDEARDRIGLRAAQLETVGAPDGDVGPLARRELPDVVAPECGCAPAATSSFTGATPAPSRRLDVGQCATPTPARPNAATSDGERCTQCAHQTSPATQPSSSRY